MQQMQDQGRASDRQAGDTPPGLPAELLLVEPASCGKIHVVADGRINRAGFRTTWDRTITTGDALSSHRDHHGVGAELIVADRDDDGLTIRYEVYGPLERSGELLVAWSPPLHRAAYHGDVPAARAALASGAAVDVPGHFGRTPLMIAAWVGHAEVAELLLSAGAAPLARQSDGRTALEIAARHPALLALLPAPVAADAGDAWMTAELLAHESAGPTLLDHPSFDPLGEAAAGALKTAVSQERDHVVLGLLAAGVPPRADLLIPLEACSSPPRETARIRAALVRAGLDVRTVNRDVLARMQGGEITPRN